MILLADLQSTEKIVPTYYVLKILSRITQERRIINEKNPIPYLISKRVDSF